MKKKLAYESYITFALGAWVMFLPFFTNRIPDYPAANTYLWNFFFVGFIVMVMSMLALRHMSAWAERVNLLFGGWLLVSPLFLVYYDKSNVLFWNSVICGVLISFFSALALPIVENVLYHHHKDKHGPYALKPHAHRH